MMMTRTAIANQLKRDAPYIAEDHAEIAGNMTAAAKMLLDDEALLAELDRLHLKAHAPGAGQQRRRIGKS